MTHATLTPPGGKVQVLCAKTEKLQKAMLRACVFNFVFVRVWVCVHMLFKYVYVECVITYVTVCVCWKLSVLQCVSSKSVAVFGTCKN